ncbi:MAG: amino acid transporter substrate-binding protein family [Alphaproteobacteria bacterium]|nr:amino acid transporter substrate-binding protein family [Alphaproteobacteria bacterium]
MKSPKRLAKKLGLKIEWTEESGWGVAEQGLQSKRFDAMCAHVCIDARRTKAAYYSIPFLHEPVYLMTRADDHRYDNDLSKANTPDTKMVILRGSIFEFAANDYFPQAKTFDAGELNPESDIFMSILSKKADVTFNTGLSIQNFDKANPGQIKKVGDPVRFCSGAFMLPLGDDRLKNLIDGGMNELIEDGQVERIIGKFLGKDNPYWYPPSPLNPPKNGFPKRTVISQ